MTHRLDGKTALITGAARGIGLAGAARLAADGANIIAFDLKGADFDAIMALSQSCQVEILPFEGDVCQEASWEAVIEAGISRFGRIDILFNNAGIFGEINHVLDYDIATFDRVLDVNVRGVFLGLRYLGRHMKAAGGGTIVNTSSISGSGGGGRVFAYTASKFAVNGMTKSAAVALAADNIRVLAIAPCPTATEMMFTAERILSPDNPEKARPALSAGIPMQRYCEPEEIASVLSFLVNEEASFMTGAIVPVDGGVLAK